MKIKCDNIKCRDHEDGACQQKDVSCDYAAEADVRGILRGGRIKDGKFCYQAGTLYVETGDFDNARVFDEKLDLWKDEND